MKIFTLKVLKNHPFEITIFYLHNQNRQGEKLQKVSDNGTGQH